MTGSLVWKPYESTVPAGGLFVVNVDESNAEATYNGSPLMAAGALAGVQRPGTLRMRKVSVELVTNPRIRRNFCVSSPLLWAQIAADPAATIQAAVGANADDSTPTAVSWAVVGAVAERYTRRPRALDTGLIDGDDT